METTKRIRQRLKRVRRELSAERATDMNQNLCRWLLDSPLLEHSRRLAAYLPHGGEPDLQPVLEKAARNHRDTFLPVVRDDPNPRLVFRAWQPGQPLQRNPFGIPEPPPDAQEITGEALCVVLVPLVAFDGQGNRLGMGAGYYDRTFAFLRDAPDTQRPALIGTAWSFQQVEALAAQEHDVPLDAAVTENGWHGPWHPRARHLLPHPS